MNHSRKLSFLLGIFFLSTVQLHLTAQYVENAYVQPAPTTCVDEIFVYIEGWLPNPCWELTGITYSITGNTVNVIVSAQYNDPGPGNYCIQLLVLWEDYIGIGKLPPGTYNLNVNNFSTTFVVNGTGNCIEPSTIDPGKNCPGTFPVCGCNGVTYVNACTAFYKNGVTSWTLGACPDPCAGNPVTTSVIGNNTICAGNSATLTATASGGQSPYTYNWNTAETTSSISPSPVANTTYTVTVTANNGCTSTASRAVTVVPAIQVSNITSSDLYGSFTLSGGLPQTNGSNYSAVTMTLQGNPGVTATLSAAPFTHNETVSFTCPQAGTYTVTATDGAGCSGVGTVVVTGAGGGGGQDTVPPCIEWQKTIGGNSQDILGSIQQTTDGGFILAGMSDSDANGNKTENSNGDFDCWVVKLDMTGNLVWQNTIGGIEVDQGGSIWQTTEGGYILGSSSGSNISGDKTNNSYGGYDYWIIKLNAAGGIVWQRTIGGAGDDILASIQQTTDGGYVLGGTSRSGASGNKTEGGYGGGDYWILKLDSSGNIVWQNTIGGTGEDVLSFIQQTFDGGYIISGWSNSNADGEKSENSYGGKDYWIIKLNVSGSIVWQNTIGGSNDDYLASICQTTDAGYILGGSSDSGSSGEKLENNNGDRDFWVIKIDPNGNIVWQNTIGGSAADYLESIDQTGDGGYILGGWSRSNIGGDKLENNNGNSDYWIIKLNTIGNIVWQNTIGGGGDDALSFIQETADGEYILCGRSYSNISGDKTEDSKGSSDYWVIKLNDDSPPPCIQTIPLHLQTSVPITTSIEWPSSGSCTVGYLLDIGTSPGGSDLLDTIIFGDITSYQPFQPFSYESTVYVRIVPFGQIIDLDGDGNYEVVVGSIASGCQEFHFTTAAPCTTVTTTAPSGPGSLRAALDCANTNPGPDTIRFNIPGPGPHTILLDGSPLFFTGDNTVLDASTQPGWYLGNIVVQNNSVPSGEAGLYINANETRIYGLSVRGFSYGIGMDATDCIIGDYGKGNHIVGDGPDPVSGIIIWSGGDIVIRGNTVGLNTGATAPEGMLECCAIGLSGSGAANVRIEGNQLGSNPVSRTQMGIDLRGNNITVLNNIIGTDSNGSANFGFIRGINAWTSGLTDVWIDQNTIAHSDTTGVRLIASAQRVKMSRNSLFCNQEYGIFLNPDVNGGIQPPVILTVTPVSIGGSATPFDTIEVFRAGNAACPGAACQGRDYLGTTVANSAGNWSLAAPFLLPLNPGDVITATATASQNNTSSFAQCRTQSLACLNDSLALVALYNATGGSTWINKTNWLQPNQPISTWYGVRTNPGGCVDTLLLDGNNLQNSLPVELGNFSGLQRLLLSNNNLTGEIPKELGRLNTLTELNLSRNPQLSGPIPDSLQNLSNLEGLYLNQTDLSGPIPDWLGNLANLRVVNLSVMPNLGGTIPPALGNLTALQKLYLNNSNLSGGLPASINNLTNLNLLNVSVNHLDQTLPTMSGMAALDSFFINQNRFTFEDFRPQMPFYSGLNRFLYTTQDSVYSDTTIVRDAGQALTIDLGFDAGMGDNLYSWYRDGQSYTAVPGNNQLTFSSLKKSDEGVYHVQVTNTAAPALTLFSRAIRVQVTCNNPPVPVINGPSALCDGSATLIVSDTYPTLPQWSTGENAPFITTSLSGLYTVTVTDANGCTGSATRNIGPNVASPVPEIDGPATLCDGSATLTVSGTYPLPPQWSNGENGQSITVLTSNLYTVTVTDANGCTGTAEHNVGPSAASPVPEISGPTALCDGSATLTISGNYPVLPAWSNNQSGQSITVFDSGLYTVTVTDANGCTGTTTQNVGGFAQSPIPTIDGPTALCDGSATLTLSDTYPVLPQWSNNQNGQSITVSDSDSYTVTVTDANGCTGTATRNIGPSVMSPQPEITGPTALCSGSVVLAVSGSYPTAPQWSNGQSGYSITASASGLYTVTVKDANGCTGTDVHSISNQGSPLATATVTPAGCNQTNGSINLSVTGGTPNYSFSWDNGANVEDPQNLGVGTYTVTITDAAQCTATATATVGNPNAPNASAVPSLSDCDQPTGSIDLAVTGGTPDYTYEWSNGATVQDPTGLAAATYTVTVTDAANCSSTAAATVTYPPSPAANAVANQAGCGQSNGSVDLTVSGGTPGFSYLWSNGDTIQDPVNLAAGSYSVTVTDEAGCTTTIAVTVTNPNAPAASAQSTAATCGLENGSIDLQVNGGTPPYQYSWSSGSVTEDLSGVAAGFYTVTITDAASCSATVSEEVEGPQPLDTVNFLITCNSAASEYVVSFAITGGTIPYSSASGNGLVTGSVFESQPIMSGASYSFNIVDSAACSLAVSGSHECNCVAEAGTMNTAVPLKACGTASVSADHNTSQLFVPSGALLLYTLHQGSGAALVNPLAWNVAPVFSYVPGVIYGETYFISAVVGQQVDTDKINVNDPCLSVAPGTPVVFLQESEVDTNVVICKGAQYQLGNNFYTDPGVYTGILENSVGCDSVVHLNLDVRAPEVVLGADTTVCIGVKLSISAAVNACSGCSYQWSEAGLQGPQITVQPETDTTYFLTITDNAGCTAQADLQVNVAEPVTIPMEATICEGEEIIVGGNSYNSAGEYDIPQISASGCIDTIHLSLEVVKAHQFVAMTDTFFCPPGQGSIEHIFRPADNDTIAPGASWRIALLSNAVAGAADITQDSQALRYRLTDLSFRGLDVIEYELCDAECSGACSSARVSIVVQDDIEKVATDLPNGFTPNGDGINDYFNPLQNYLDQNYVVPVGRVSLTIINRWGEIVYQANPYQYFNELEGGWDGRNGNGSAVIPGTYYYMLRLDVGETVVVKGAVQVLTD